MAKYSIQDTTLTAIGDAIRDKTGEYIRIESRPKQAEVFKSPNVDKVEDVVNYDITQRTGASDSDPTSATFTIPGAVKLIITAAINNYLFGTTTVFYQIGIPGESHYRFVARSEDVNGQIITYEVPGDTVHIYLNNINYTSKRNAYYFEVRGYDADDNLITDENVLVPTEVPNTLTPAQMAIEIEELPTYEPPEEALVLTGSLDYRFSYNGWNWFINDFGDRITTEKVTSLDHLAYNSASLEEIPFDINMDTTKVSHNATYAFSGCWALKELPNIYNFKPQALTGCFANCRSLRYFSDNVLDWDLSYLNGSSGGLNGMFADCCSLRSIPSEFLKKLTNTSTSSYSSPYYNFYKLKALDEVIGMPVNPVKYTSNAFSGTFQRCDRLANIIFNTNEDGSAIAVDWNKQTIDLTSGVGFDNTSNDNDLINYNSGITRDKKVTDDATYQALKNDPDWYTHNVNYSRYNHDSAVNTINSLPDVSNSSTGGNSIKFKSASGALTDGGAISNLTEEEIAVAAAKGWTVTLV